MRPGFDQNSDAAVETRSVEEGSMQRETAVGGFVERGERWRARLRGPTCPTSEPRPTASRLRTAWQGDFEGCCRTEVEQN